MEDTATERPEVLGSAVGVGALDPGDASAVITAADKALHRLGDPLEAELPESLGELILVAGDELREVGTEEPLEGARSPLVVAAGGRRIQRESQLVCHMRIHSPEERAALLNLVERGRLVGGYWCPSGHMRPAELIPEQHVMAL